MRPLHVLMTADAVGGVWRYALDLAGGLAPHGVSTTLALLGPAPDADQRAEAGNTPGVRLVETGLELDWLADIPEAVTQGAAALATLARECGADLVHLNSPSLAGCARFPVPVLGACHSCLGTWWDTVRGGGALPADFAWRVEQTARGYRAADALIAPSVSFAHATAKRYALPCPPLAVPNGRRPATAAPRPGAVGVITAGRLWDEGKGIATLDRAAAQLPVPVHGAGPLTGPNGAAVKLHHLHALGRLDEAELAGWYAATPVFASAALYEPFGLAVLEAAQAGCALVLSDIPSFRELWDGAALFAPAGDADAFAATIRAALADHAQLGAAARAHAARYTVAAMAEGTLAAYRRLLSLEAAA